jgi:Spy/CpxP family protein refolding chaperone
MESVMKKSIWMGLGGLGLALALGATAAAQQHPGHEGRGNQKQEAGARRGRGGPDGLLLKGIELTEGQRAQIAQLRKTQRDTMASRRDAMKKEFDAMREARQRGDTAAVRAQMAKLRQAREQERTRHVAAIRNILTAEQRVQFDKNVAELKQRAAERVAKLGERGKGRRARRGR